MHWLNSHHHLFAHDCDAVRMQLLGKISLSGSPARGHSLSTWLLTIQLSIWASSPGGCLPRDRKQYLPGLPGLAQNWLPSHSIAQSKLQGSQAFRREEVDRGVAWACRKRKGTWHHLWTLHHLCRRSTTLCFSESCAWAPAIWSDPMNWRQGWRLLSPKRKGLTFPTFEKRTEFPS